MRKEWTQEENLRLMVIAKDASNRLSVEEIGKLFGRSAASVQHRAQRLGCPQLGRKKIRAYPQEMKDRVIELNGAGKTAYEIEEETGMPYASVIQTIKKAGMKTNDPTRWSPEEIAWIRAHYAELGSTACGIHFGVAGSCIAKAARANGIPKGKRKGTRKRVFDEMAICRAYETAKGLKEVAAQFDTDYNTISRILKRHGVQVELYSRFREHQEGIVADYQAGKMSVSEIGRRYGLSNDRVTEGLKNLGLHDPSRSGQFANKINYYDCWVAKHGKEKADEMLKVYQAKMKLLSRSGKDNPMYGKPTPQGAGNGWKGWYRDIYFRSLREVMFMIGMDEKEIQWSSAETKAYTIEYEQDGVSRTYRPDFIAGNELWELKPIKLHNTPNVTAKRLAAERFCAERGLTYRLEDIEIDKDVIHDAYEKGLIRFDRDYEKRFLEYVA